MTVQSAQERYDAITQGIRDEIKILTTDLESDLSRGRGATNGRLWQLQKNDWHRARILFRRRPGHDP